MIRALRSITNDTVNKEPKWRHRGRELTTGYHPTTYGRALGNRPTTPVQGIGKGARQWLP